MPTWMEVIIRTSLAIIVLFIITKILGKRQVSQLSLFEYITGISIGNLAGAISLDLDNTWFLGVLSLGVWVLFSLGIEMMQIKNKKIRDFVDGKSTPLIQDGHILEANLKKERLTSDELMEQLRSKNVFRMADVEFATMEPNGMINVLLKKELLPLTPQDMSLTMPREQEPEPLIMDGKVLQDKLRQVRWSQQQLDKELRKLGVESKDVFLAQLDSHGQLYVDLYNDQQQITQYNDLNGLMTMLQNCETQLKKLQNAPSEKERQRLQHQCEQEINAAIQKVKARNPNSIQGS
ncbi:DUF421 domain-containing protein [Paenibacillus sp. JX-17]|uniref:DUF421 domain-containing protein n=1 Tax=Paenibacillus lacisoli TaxID=3064525 RepID=A0ABT9C8Q1_9BACL|nr:DUF421 domain-containing protein [Paenibacillus sp. JX-17]MDO7905624.1 DUF421 domain-containing protein [Paenibacillus sp. JX-17]